MDIDAVVEVIVFVYLLGSFLSHVSVILDFNIKLIKMELKRGKSRIILL